ncbi:MAG: hypothetical protein NVSMB46_06340 [Candidatus Saccharimonadales bacterium]
MIAKLLSSKFFRQNAVLFVGSSFVGLLNYIFYPIIGRLLNVSQFGEVQALFSILLNVGILFTALSLVIVHISANRKTHQATPVVLDLEKVSFMIILVTGLVWLASVTYIMHFLKLTNHIAVIIFYFAVLLGLFIATRQAYIQGKEDFSSLAKVGVINSVAKLIFSVALVIAGFGILGAILGLIIGQIIGLCYVLLRARKLGLPVKIDLSPKVKWSILLPELRFIIPVFLVSLAITLLFSGDILAVKHYFSAEMAGQYAGVAAIGRIIIFLTISVNAVLFAKIKLSQTIKENKDILIKSLLLFSVIAGSASLPMILIPKLLMRLLLGARYQGGYTNLPWLAICLFLLAAVNLVFYYDLALRRKRAAIISIIGLLLTIILISINHGAVRSIILDIIYATVGMIMVRGMTGIILSKKG